jgi:hypothetical protein
MTIPTAAAVAAPAYSPAEPYTQQPPQYAGYAPPYAAAAQPAYPSAYHPYGRPPPGALAYASPVYGNHQPGWGVLREGKQVVANDNAALPPVCVKCGEPSDGPLIRRRLSWFPPYCYFGLFGGLLVFAILAVVMTKHCRVHIGLCARHRARWKLDQRIGMALLIATPFVVGSAFYFESGWPALAALVFLIAGLIMMFGASPILRPKHCDGSRIWLGGSCEAFLSRLPTVQQAQAAHAAQFAAAYPAQYPPAYQAPYGYPPR